MAGFGFLVLQPAAVVAGPVCTTGSLASYISLDVGGGCTLGNFTFFRFAAPAPLTVGSPTLADDSQILITPFLTATGAGLGFSASSGETNLFAISSPSGTTSVTYFIDYSVDPAPVIGGARLQLDPPYGDASATQIYCTSDVLANGCALGTQSQQMVTVASPDSALIFTNPSAFVDVATDISLVATPGHPAGIDSVNSEFDNVSNASVPEPFLLPLTAGLLGGLFLWRRRRA